MAPYSPYMGGCQNCGPSLGTLNIRCRMIIGILKGIMILTTTHIIQEVIVASHFTIPS